MKTFEHELGEVFLERLKCHMNFDKHLADLIATTSNGSIDIVDIYLNYLSNNNYSTATIIENLYTR